MRLSESELILRINGSPYYPDDAKRLATSIALRIVEAYGLSHADGLGGLNGYTGEREEDCRKLLRDIEKMLDIAYRLGRNDGIAFVRLMATGDVTISEINAVQQGENDNG